MKTLEFKIRKAQVHSSETEKKKLEKYQPSRVYVSEEALIELTGSRDGGKPITIERSVAEKEDDAVPDGPLLREATLWKAPQRLDKGVAQMYDSFCEACSYRLGDIVKITASAASTVPDAEEVVFEDVTDTAVPRLPSGEVYPWEFFLASRLARFELPAHLHAGMAQKDLSLDGPPRSFTVLTVNGSPICNARYVHKKTVIKIIEKTVSRELSNGVSQNKLAASGVRGLDAQIRKINQLLACYNRDFPIPSLRRPRGLLIHGGHGTGKTLILNSLANSGWGTVYRVLFTDKLSQIQETFQKALAQRPSLVLIDNLERLIDKERSTRQAVIQTICKAFDDLAAEAKTTGELPRVAIIASCLDYLADVPEDLQLPGRFRINLPIPTPDVDTRREILLSFDLGLPSDTAGDFLSQLSEKTHAYNGTDLRSLVDEAHNNWSKRLEDDAGFEAAEAGVDFETYALAEDFEKALKIVRPSAMRDVNLKPPPIRWGDIGGQDAVKRSLRLAARLFTMPKNDLHLFLDGPPKGVLLYGPPGCSKTMTAQAMATESGLNFFAVKGAELLNMYVGESERAIRQLFKRARDAMPSIIFFDEIDSIAGARSGFGGTASSSHGGLNVLTTLLNEMDGFENMEGVLVLAATNRPQAIDPALLRPGRFDKLVYVPPPDEAARRAIFAGVATKKRIPGAGIDVDALAQRTDGFSGAEIKAICATAGEAAVERFLGEGAAGSKEITMADFDLAIQNQQRQITSEMLDGYAQWEKKFRRS